MYYDIEIYCMYYITGIFYFKNFYLPYQTMCEMMGAQIRSFTHIWRFEPEPKERLFLSLSATPYPIYPAGTHDQWKSLIL